MTDEIYDYFGGSSPRKMEPLDESEMFEDLLPSKKPEPVEEPPIEVMFDEDLGSVPEASMADSWSSQSQDDVLKDAVERSAPVKSHWDDLASSLGLSPPSAIDSPKTSKPVAAERKQDNPEKLKVKAELENKRAPKSGDRTRQRDDKLIASPKANPQPVESDADCFSELFFSPDEIDFEATTAGIDVPPEDDFENDPFAAFSGSQASRRKEPEFEVEVEVEESQSEILDINEPVNKDYIEFEVQDIGGQRRDERETRSRRGHRPDRTEKRSGSEQVRKPSGHDDKESIGESRETNEGRRHQRTESKGREPQRNETRRDRDGSGSRTDGNRTEGGRTEGSRTEGSRTQHSRAQGSRAQGSRTEGSRTGSGRTQGDRAEGDRAESNRAESNRAEGNRSESNRSEGNRSEGNRSEGNRSEGNRSEGNRTEANQTEGNRGDANRTDNNRGSKSGRNAPKRDKLERDPVSRDQKSADRSSVRAEKVHENSDDELENDIGIKKAKIPTWDEAIGGVVEQNIKRHQSNTKGGGKRRRN